MGKQVIFFATLIIIASLFQVSLFPFPFGIGLIIIWFLINGTKYLSLFILIFSYFIGVLSNMPIWLVFLSSSVSVSLFMFGRSYFPTRQSATVAFVIASFITWEFVFLIYLKVT